jgi:hypothetical protein
MCDLGMGILQLLLPMLLQRPVTQLLVLTDDSDNAGQVVEDGRGRTWRRFLDLIKDGIILVRVGLSSSLSRLCSCCKLGNLEVMMRAVMLPEEEVR